MSYKNVTIISIIVTAIFVMPLFSFAGETVPGAPFQVLQDQIDGLQIQIDNIQQQMCAAYSTHLPASMVIPDDPVVVMSIDLPAGDYVSTISLGLQYQAEGHGFWPECWAFYECSIIDDDTGLKIGNAYVGGNVVGVLPQSGTNILTLFNNTTVALECFVGCRCCSEYPETPLNLLSGSWTLIRVDHK